MGFFGPSKDERANARNEVMQKLSSNEYIETLMHVLLMQAGKEPMAFDEAGNPAFDIKPWLTQCMGYYDNRKRTIQVGPDIFGIRWADFHQEPKSVGGTVVNAWVEDLHDNIGYGYTNDGYMPLHAYSNGTVSVSTTEVVTCWAEVLVERMKALFPELTFKSVRSSYHDGINGPSDEVYIDYEVRPLVWKDWF